MSSVIKISGARQHNLKNISLEIPRDKLVVITGPSGSGKSSLAFDTLYAEGQRRYVESLSAYARQFLDQMEKPEVDFIEGLSPAIAIEQRNAAGNPRSIIATSTEIYDYLRLLFTHAGTPHSHTSGREITKLSIDEIVDNILGWEEFTRIMLLSPIVREEKGDFKEELEHLQHEGFVRVLIDNKILDLSSPTPIKLSQKEKHNIDVIVDRLTIKKDIRSRLTDSTETALRYGNGRMLILFSIPDCKEGEQIEGAGSSYWQKETFSNQLLNPDTLKAYDPAKPGDFSFNFPQGACPSCSGLGKIQHIAPGLIIKIDKSLEDGAIYPWRCMGQRMVLYYRAMIKWVAAHYNQPLDVPWKDLPKDFRQILLYGSGEEEMRFTLRIAGKLKTSSKPFEGIIPNLMRIYTTTESEAVRGWLRSFMVPEICPECHGARLRPEILAITLPGERKKKIQPKVPGLSIMDVCQMSVEEACGYFEKLKLGSFKEKIVKEVLKEIRARLKFLLNVGLGYLNLNRESGTLSGGEAQRIRLASQIGAGLMGVLYILDEPSIGLHQRDNKRLLETLEHLRKQGNSVIVVEHDEETIRKADFVVDMGPKAGVEGGEVVASGTPAQIAKNPKSLTGRYLSGNLKIEVPKNRVKPSDLNGWIEVIDATENNLKHITARFPLGLITCVTGISGSGKSTLVDDILHKTISRDRYGAKVTPGHCKQILGTELINKLVVVDQEPIGRTPRSNPATYTGMFDDIRNLFAKLPAAKLRGYKPGRFSFNVRGGRCEKCKGDGLISIEMHFLPSVYVTCEACGGKRYNRETLEVTYKGKNISDVLNMPVSEAVEFFDTIPAIHNTCKVLDEVGLGYVTLGQSATTLSGGEAQRIKLATELKRKATGHTLYILDEPTTGLHFHDVKRLLDTLFRLRDGGNTLIIIEHNLDVIKSADWIIDMGPEGGEFGGEIIAEGTPETVAQCKKSFTGQFLKESLRQH